MISGTPYNDNFSLFRTMVLLIQGIDRLEEVTLKSIAAYIHNMEDVDIFQYIALVKTKTQQKKPGFKTATSCTTWSFWMGFLLRSFQEEA